MTETDCSPVVGSYEPPELIEVGDVVELTNGSQEDDTADKKEYYY